MSQPGPRVALARPEAEGAAFQLAFTAAAFAALEARAPICEARRARKACR